MSVQHASSMGPAVMEEGGQQACCLVAKQAVEFPQVLASLHKMTTDDNYNCAPWVTPHSTGLATN